VQKIMARNDKQQNAAKTPAQHRKKLTNRPYFGVQEPEFTEGGGFGRHRETVFGESQEGSRNPSGKTVQPPVPSVPPTPKKHPDKTKKS
jgi:hypothetical protein